LRRINTPGDTARFAGTAGEVRSSVKASGEVWKALVLPSASAALTRA
jgi:hypothetical protein